MSRNEEAAAQNYDRILAEIVSRIHKIAEDVARDGAPHTAYTGWRKGELDYIYASQRVIHAITWGVANLSVDHLVDAADGYHSMVAFEKRATDEA
jgi:hypothetical protein